MNFKWEQRETALTLEMTGTSWHNESCTGNMINRGGQRESCARARSRVVLAHELFGLILVRVSFYSFSTQTHAQMRSHTLNTPTHRTTHTPAAAALRPHHARTHARTHTHTEHNSPAKAGAQGTHASARALVNTHAGARALKHFDTHLSALAFSQTEPGTSGSGTGGGCGCGGGSGCTNISEAFCPFIISSHII